MGIFDLRREPGSHRPITRNRLQNRLIPSPFLAQIRQIRPIFNSFNFFSLFVSRFVAPLRVTWQVGITAIPQASIAGSTAEEVSMVISYNSRVGFMPDTNLQDRVQRMTVAPESIGTGDASRSSKKAHDTESIVEELVSRYLLHSSTTTSGIFRF